VCKELCEHGGKLLKQRGQSPILIRFWRWLRLLSMKVMYAATTEENVLHIKDGRHPSLKIAG
jgi:hypothetical protein